MDYLPISIGAVSVTAFLTLIITVKRKKRLIGEKVTVEYFDQNEAFASVLPKTGSIDRQEKVGGQNLTVVRFEKPLNYRNVNYSEIYIKERYEHERIKHNSESHTFILLPIPGLHDNPTKLEQFDMVAWAIVRHTDAEQTV